MSNRYKSLLTVTASVSLASTSLLAAPAFATNVTDLGSAASWAKSYILKAASLGLMTGDPNGNFRPTDTLTRQEVAKILCTALNLKTTPNTTPNFSDVSSSDWGAQYIAAVTKANIMSGDGNGSFRPNDSITREELAVVLVRSLHVGYYGLGSDLTVADKGSISDWAKDYVAAAIKYGLMSGDGVNFNPKQMSTRQEMAVIVVNYTNVRAKLNNPSNNNGGGTSDSGSGSSDDGSGSGSDTTSDGTGFDSSVPGQSPVIPGEVSALNPNEIRISFPTAVYQASALDKNNYQLIAGGRTVKSVVMGQTNSTVILQLSSPLRNGDTYQVNVSSVTSASYQALAPYLDKTHLFGDTIAPAVVGTPTISGNQLKLTFNKPVKDNMMVKIDNVIVADGSTNKVTSTGAPGDYSVYTPPINNQTLLNSTNHTVTVYFATDYGTPANESQILTTHYYGTTQSLPTVKSITPVSATSFRVTFSQQLGIPLSTSNLVVKKGTVDLGSYLDVQPDSSDLTGTSYIVTINNDTEIPLYSSTTTNSASLSVTISGYENTAMQVGTSYTNYVTLLRPTTPAIVTGMNTISGNTLTLQFNEPLFSTLVGDFNTITVKTSDNIIKPVTGATVTGDKLVLSFGAPLDPGTYSINVPANMVNDQYGHSNLAFSTSASEALTPYLPIVANSTPGVVNPGEAGIATGDVDVVTINYGKKMNTSATYAGYYQLDGKPLPSGTTINFTDRNNPTTVKIAFPAGTFNQDQLSALTITKSVTAQNGQIVETSTGGTVSFQLQFTGNTQPKLTKAQYKLHNAGDTATDELLLTFSEPLVNGGDTDDYKVTVTNANTTLTYTVGAISGNTLELDLPNSINTSQTVTIYVVPVSTSNPVMDAVDANGNRLYSGTTVTITGSTL